MADKKISQLTAATTPLAGTEVLPIVQSGSTVKVSVDNLTTGRSISATGATLTGLTASKPVFTDASKVLTNTGTVPIANGGTNQTAFTAKSGNVAGLVYFDGTSLANDTTVTDVGYDTSTNTVKTKNLDSSGTLTVKQYTESVVVMGTVGASQTIDLTNGTIQTATLTASTATTFTMPTVVAGKSFVLFLKQAASTGNGTATFTSVKWNAAGAPTITATAGRMDILSFFSDGTNWYGSINQGFTP